MQTAFKSIWIYRSRRGAVLASFVVFFCGHNTVSPRVSSLDVFVGGSPVYSATRPGVSSFEIFRELRIVFIVDASFILVSAKGRRTCLRLDVLSVDSAIEIGLVILSCLLGLVDKLHLRKRDDEDGELQRSDDET
jgi:hypothetical protein